MCGVCPTSSVGDLEDGSASGQMHIPGIQRGRSKQTKILTSKENILVQKEKKSLRSSSSKNKKSKKISNLKTKKRKKQKNGKLAILVPRLIILTCVSNGNKKIRSNHSFLSN